MAHPSNYDTITRVLSLNSTASGYTVTATKMVKNGAFVAPQKTYNLTGASMRRFYRLSGNWTVIECDKQIDWRNLARLRGVL